MLYTDAIEQATSNALRSAKGADLRLATITSIASDGRAYVKFAGESLASTKLYPYLFGFAPTQGDTVCMLKQGDTYIIAGTVKNTALSRPYALANHTHSEYLTSETGALKIHSHDGYAAANHTHSGYAASSHTHSNLVNGVKSISLNSSGELNPYSSSNCALGSSSAYYSSVHAQNFVWHSGSSTSISLTYSNISSMRYPGSIYYNSTAVAQTTSTSVLSPTSNKGASLGTSSVMWNNIYGYNIYKNGSAVSTSDRRLKKNIKDLPRKFLDLISKLRPVSFLWKDGDDRAHTGFIAQEVEQAVKSVGLTENECAIVNIQDNGEYGLRYEELIAVQTLAIQELTKRVEELEAKLNK